MGWRGMGNLLALFSGKDSGGLVRLWSSDGTPSGTIELAVSGASALGFNPQDLVTLNGKVLFGGRDELSKPRLWASDGTAGGTAVVPVLGTSVTNGLAADHLAVVGNRVLFYGINTANAQGLWESDGTAVGTAEMAIGGAALPGPQPTEITAFGTLALFSGKTPANVRMLGVADPLSGVGNVLAIAGAHASGLDPHFIRALGGVALFQGRDTADHLNLWVTDGTEGGTVALAVAGTPASGLNPTFSVVLGGKLLFNGRDSANRASLWMSDGTAGGTVKIDVAGASASGLSPGQFGLFAGNAYFSGVNAAGVRGLWVTDGTAVGTSEIAVVGAYAGAPGLAGGVTPTNFADGGHRLLFEGINAAGDLGLWITDGTSVGTSEIAPAGRDAGGLAPTSITVLSAGVACFAQGTRLRVPGGVVAVECLVVGDVVLTAAGREVAVRWLGHRQVGCAEHPRPWDVWPVRVQRDAFGPGMPAHDVWLSPDHSVFVDGVLIPVRYLLNGASIVQEQWDAVTYWHVELDRHDVLLAEGLAVESYLDTGNRADFANGGTVVRMTPEFAQAVWREEACAPLVCDGEALASVRARLIGRAIGLGHVLVRDPGLVVRAGGREIEPFQMGGRFLCHLPARTTRVELGSLTAIPAEIRRFDADHRRLGVHVQMIAIDGVAVPLDDAALVAGWHAPEPDGRGRWTDGAGCIARAEPMRVVEFVLAPLLSYWAAPKREKLAARIR